MIVYYILKKRIGANNIYVYQVAIVKEIKCRTCEIVRVKMS